MSDILDRHVIDEAAQLLEQPGVWTRGTYDDGGHLCLVGAVLRPTCQPGDNHLWRVWLRRNGLDENWNDSEALDASHVVAALRSAPDPTETDMVDMFGPQWRAICDLVRRCAVLTEDEAKRLDAAWAAAWDAAWDPAREAAWAAAWDAAWDAAREAAWDASRDAAWDASRHASRDAAWCAARAAAPDAALALVCRDLIGQHGGFTQDHYDTLTGPWATTIGKAHPDDTDRLVTQ